MSDNEQGVKSQEEFSDLVGEESYQLPDKYLNEFNDQDLFDSVTGPTNINKFEVIASSDRKKNLETEPEVKHTEKVP